MYGDLTIDQIFCVLICTDILGFFIFLCFWKCGALSQIFGIQGNNNEEMSKMPIVWISEVGFLLGIGVDRMGI